MGKPQPSRERLERLLSLARTYRNWSGRELAEEMGRDPHNVVPSSGVPRLDLVLRLAEALEWTPQDVIEELCRVDDAPRGAGPAGESYDDLDRRAFELQRECRFAELVQVAQRMLASAETGTQRANAKLRECSGWEGLGRYSLALSAVQQGLREQQVSEGVALTLRTNLAHSHFLLGNLDESASIATCLITALQTFGPVAGAFFEGSLGFLLSVRGNCERVRAGLGSTTSERHLRAAIADFLTAQPLLSRAAVEHRVEAYRGVAKLGQGALIELRAMAGEISPREAVESVLSELDAAAQSASGDAALMEARGWWCIFGANVILRHALEADWAEQAIAILTNKADEIALQLGHWALRERVWSIEFQRRELVGADQRAVSTPAMDSEDLRSVVGTMSRFPAFRATGWTILRSTGVF